MTGDGSVRRRGAWWDGRGRAGRMVFFTVCLAERGSDLLVREVGRFQHRTGGAPAAKPITFGTRGFRRACPVLPLEPGQARVRRTARGLAVFVGASRDRRGAMVGCVISPPRSGGNVARRVRDFTHRCWRGGVRVGQWCVRARTLRLATPTGLTTGCYFRAFLDISRMRFPNLSSRRDSASSSSLCSVIFLNSFAAVNIKLFRSSTLV